MGVRLSANGSPKMRDIEIYSNHCTISWRADAWLIGRVSGRGFGKRDAYPDHATDRHYAPEPWFARRGARAYGIILDPHGKIAWGRSKSDLTQLLDRSNSCTGRP
jgi:hypothetical protein